MMDYIIVYMVYLLSVAALAAVAFRVDLGDRSRTVLSLYAQGAVGGALIVLKTREALS